MEMKRWHGALLALPVAGLALATSGCDDNNATNATGAVSQTAVTVSPASGPTATMFNFTGQIATSGKAEVTYRWEHDDGSMTPVASLSFDSAGTQIVTHAWDPGGCSTSSRDRWVKLDVLTPNAMSSTQTFVKQDASPSCP